MPSILIVLICAAVSAALTAAATFLPVLNRVFYIAGFVWLGAALPVLYFCNVGWQYVLVFYLLAGLVNMAIASKGKPQ